MVPTKTSVLYKYIYIERERERLQISHMQMDNLPCGIELDPFIILATLLNFLISSLFLFLFHFIFYFFKSLDSENAGMLLFLR